MDRDSEIEYTLALLRLAWKQSRDQRLMQFLLNALLDTPPNALFYVADEELQRALIAHYGKLRQ